MIKKIIKTMITAAGKNSAGIAADLDITRASMTHYLNADFSQLRRFLQIARLCGFKVILTNENGTTIDLTSIPAEKEQKNSLSFYGQAACATKKEPTSD